MDSLLHSLDSLSPALIYFFLFAVAYVENIFPPSPSDIVVVFGGSLAGIGKIDFIPALLITTLGSISGFITMYKVGDWFGESIVEQRKLKFIPLDNLHRVESWFQQYGYWIIVVNRFLSGTRAIVSFFAGLSKLNLPRTTMLCGISALAWNGFMIYAGMLLGKNWQSIGFYLSTYSQIITGIILTVCIAWFLRWLYRRNRKS